MSLHDVLIVGAGPAGYTAAIYAARAMRSTAVIAGPQPGGQLTITTGVENYPGFADPVMGPDLMEQMRLQAERLGVAMVEDIVSSARLDQTPFAVVGETGTVYSGGTLIIATGAQAKWLGLPSEARFVGHGVSACATCDGFFHRDKEVIVVGGGNTAAEEALFLTGFASGVRVVHRRDTLRADRILQDKMLAHPKIEMEWNCVLDDVVGTDEPLAVTGAVIRHLPSGQVRRIEVHGVFIAIGHTPSTAVFADHLRTTHEGYIVVEAGSSRTSIPGVFAAGDACDPVYRQAVTAAGMGCMAALDAEAHLSRHSKAQALFRSSA